MPAIVNNLTTAVAADTALRVLIMAGEPLMRWALVQRLVQAGHQVLEASAVCDALTVAEREAPDVIVLDRCFADCHDFTFLPTLRQRVPRAGIVVIACPCDGPELMTKAWLHGVSEVLPTPFDLDELTDAVDNAACHGAWRAPIAAPPGAEYRRRFFFDKE
jgi:DNA-binding NtrC family response regulator